MDEKHSKKKLFLAQANDQATLIILILTILIMIIAYDRVTR